jgi:hypothetical protein
MAVGIRRADHTTPSIHKSLALTSLTSDGFWVGTFSSRTKATELLIIISLDGWALTCQVRAAHLVHSYPKAVPVDMPSCRWVVSIPAARPDISANIIENYTYRIWTFTGKWIRDGLSCCFQKPLVCSSTNIVMFRYWQSRDEVQCSIYVYIYIYIYILLEKLSWLRPLRAENEVWRSIRGIQIAV